MSANPSRSCDTGRAVLQASCEPIVGLGAVAEDSSGGRSVVGGRLPCSHPRVGKQFRESAFRMAADAFEDVAQIGKRIDAEPLACGDEAGQHRRRPSAVIASKKHVFSTRCE